MCKSRAGLTSSVRGVQFFPEGEGVQFFPEGRGCMFIKGERVQFVGGGGGRVHVFQREGDAGFPEERVRS